MPNTEQKLTSQPILAEQVSKPNLQPFTSAVAPSMPFRDVDRWSETSGFPPISGGSGKGLDDNGQKLRPVKEVAKFSSLSLVRIQALIKAGKIKGELRKEGRGRGRYYTSISEVEMYQENLWTPQEWGSKGGRIAGRGRPKSPSENEKSIDS